MSDTRWAWVEIDLDAIRHNIAHLRAVAYPAAVWAVVKADGYGHGAVDVARAAMRAGAEGLCVALVAEGLALRRAGIDAPILILSEQPPETVGHIVEHRSDELTKPIDEMAGGRVFSGRQALDLGLVDQLGTLSDAVQVAAEMARVADYELRVIPKPPTIFDMFDKLKGERDRSRIAIGSSIAGTFFGQQAGFLEALLPVLGALDPQRVSVLEAAIQRLDILHSEHVVLMPPVALIGFGAR